MNDLQGMLDDIDREIILTRDLTGKDAFDDKVMAAMKQVPRHKFVPDYARYLAYLNGPVPIGLGQTISQPYIVALMTDLLEIGADDTILEIGTGSGYQAAVLSLLVKQVYSVEILEPLASKACRRLQRLGYDNVEIRTGDGHWGWSEHAPYDGIIVTAAASSVPDSLLDQLSPGARLVIPVGLPYSYQELRVLQKHADGRIEAGTILGVSFVPLVGGNREKTANPGGPDDK